MGRILPLASVQQTFLAEHPHVSAGQGDGTDKGDVHQRCVVRQMLLSIPKAAKVSLRHSVTGTSGRCVHLTAQLDEGSD